MRELIVGQHIVGKETDSKSLVLVPTARYLCVHLPHWAITRRLRRRPELLDKPVVVVETVRRGGGGGGGGGGRVDVVDGSPAAMKAGVGPGMSLAEGRAICPGLLVLERQAEKDRLALEALGRWMTRFTPFVATGWPVEKGDKGTLHRPMPLLLNVAGCERFFGSMEIIVREVRAALKRFGLPARVAVAPTPGAAWALAWSGKRSGRIVGADELAEAVAGLPVEALRLCGEIVASLRNLGLRTIGQVMALPRETLPSRFGEALLRRLDEVLGARADLLLPLGYEVPVEARLEMDGAVESLEVLWLVLQELVGRVVTDLERRCEGARRLELICKSDPADGLPPVVRTVALSRPSRDGRRLIELLRCATEKLDCGKGFVDVRLKVPLHERMTAEQMCLLESEVQADQNGFEQLMDRLTVRLGAENVVCPVAVASYIPERAWRGAGFHERNEGVGQGGFATAIARPTVLLKTPAEVRVVAEPSDDREGRPAQMTYMGRVHRLAHVLGPERLAGEWWRGHGKVRDYYDALDETGRRFWLFRVVTQQEESVSVRWFLHGMFL